MAARNEERAIGRCLASLLRAARFAERRRALRIEILVVLDRCTDGTAEVVAQFPGVQTTAVTGGKIEAQRRGLRPGPFNIFSDADIEVSEETLLALCEAMDARPEAQIAFPPKQPLPPRRRTPLARALHAYNSARGYASARTWFSGKLFAIRAWDVPTRATLAARAAALPRSRFHAWEEGLRADDIFLSRICVLAHGPAALLETREGMLCFRAPETFSAEELHRAAGAMARYGSQVTDLFGTPDPEQIARAYGVASRALAGAIFAERCFWPDVADRG